MVKRRNGCAILAEYAYFSLIIKKAGDKKSQKLFIYPLFTYTLTITTYEYNCND